MEGKGEIGLSFSYLLCYLVAALVSKLNLALINMHFIEDNFARSLSLAKCDIWGAHKTSL